MPEIFPGSEGDLTSLRLSFTPRDLRFELAAARHYLTSSGQPPTIADFFLANEKAVAALSNELQRRTMTRTKLEETILRIARDYADDIRRLNADLADADFDAFAEVMRRGYLDRLG